MARRIELHGHRGARGLWPENTLAGFRGAIALGVDAIEMDVAVTADDVVVVSHDPALNPDITRGPDGVFLSATGPLIRHLREKDLAKYDVGRLRPGTAYAARYPAQQPQDGARIPTLAEVLALDPAAGLSIELKTSPDHPDWTVPPEAMADLVLDELERAGALPRTRLISFDWRTLRAAHRRCPAMKLTFLTEADTVAAAPLWWGGSSPADFGGSVPRAIAAEAGAAKAWGPFHGDLTEASVAEAHALGLQVMPWTVNEAADMARLLGWGVDGLTTDRPDRARAALDRAGL